MFHIFFQNFNVVIFNFLGPNLLLLGDPPIRGLLYRCTDGRADKGDAWAGNAADKHYEDNEVAARPWTTSSEKVADAPSQPKSAAADVAGSVLPQQALDLESGHRAVETRPMSMQAPQICHFIFVEKL